MPLAGAFAPTRREALAAERHPLTWLWCATCGLVNVAPDIPDATLYAQYAYAASTIPALVRHHAEYAAHLAATHTGPVRLLEIGCNDGVLLRQLPPEWELVGVDPSDVAARARGGWDLVNLPYTSDLDLGTFDVITASNTFAHFSGLGDAFDGVRRALRPQGTFYLEVHDLDATLASAQWDTIYHEHKVEWSIASLTRAAMVHGLRLIRAERLPLHGGLIRAVFGHPARRFTFDPPSPPDARRLREAYAWRRDTRAYHQMMKGGAAYGAAGRAVVYLNQLPELPIAYVVDGSPLRFGKYLPGVGLPIVRPRDFDFDQPGQTLVTAWNHAADIKARHPDYHRWVLAW